MMPNPVSEFNKKVETAYLLNAATATRVLGQHLGGTSTDKLWSPAELKEYIDNYADNLEKHAVEMLLANKDKEKQ